ncbi:MAG: acyltransferase family protein [Bacteroidaceae bacterium]|nr:acyltransferase family protein [Bacteroidaceae bacterium]
MEHKLTRQDTNLLKGLAIVGIILHNFCHMLPRIVAENEYTYHTFKNAQLLGSLEHGYHVGLSLLSYFGHYGVPVFLLLSGYGLVMKYERGTIGHIGVKDFILYNARKLWHLLWIGLALWLIFFFSEHGFHEGFPTRAFVTLLTFTTNFVFKEPHLQMIMGPWWFFGLIMQMYVVYRLLFYRRGDVWLLGAAAVSLALLAYAVSRGEADQTLLNYLRYNCVGEMLPFAVGVWMGRHGVIRSWAQTAVCGVLFLLCCFNAYAWILTPTLLALALLQAVALRGTLRSVLETLGVLSASIFVVHPLVRAVIHPTTIAPSEAYWPLFLYLIITLALAIVYKQINDRIRF